MKSLRKMTTLAAATLLACASSSAWADGIGASLLTQQHPFYIELADAMKAEAKAQNVPLEVAIANQDLSKQLADIEDMIVKGVDVLVISPVDSKGVLPAIQKAQKAGIKVITVDVPAEGVEVLSYVGTDNYKGGEKAGELMAQVLNNKGEVAIINYPTVQSVVSRIDGFKKALEGHPEVKIVAEQTGITRAEAALAAAVAVKSAGLQDKVKVIGFDGMQEARDAVDNDPVMVGVIRQYPDQMGKKAVETAVAVMKGETVPAQQPIEPGVYTGKAQ